MITEKLLIFTAVYIVLKMLYQGTLHYFANQKETDASKVIAFVASKLIADVVNFGLVFLLVTLFEGIGKWKD